MNPVFAVSMLLSGAMAHHFFCGDVSFAQTHTPTPFPSIPVTTEMPTVTHKPLVLDANVQRFKAAANAVVLAAKRRKPLVSFVGKEGFIFHYSGYDRAAGTKTSIPLKLQPENIDKVIKVKINADGHGWEVEEGQGKPSPITYDYDIKLFELLYPPSENAADFERHVQVHVDEQARTLMLTTDALTITFIFAEEIGEYKIKRVEYTEEDPG